MRVFIAVGQCVAALADLRANGRDVAVGVAIAAHNAERADGDVEVARSAAASLDAEGLWPIEYWGIAEVLPHLATVARRQGDSARLRCSPARAWRSCASWALGRTTSVT